MTSLDDLQPRFRLAALQARKEGRTLDEIAEASHLGRTTVYRLMIGTLNNPRPAVRACAERFVAFQKERTEPTDTQG